MLYLALSADRELSSSEFGQYQFASILMDSRSPNFPLVLLLRCEESTTCGSPRDFGRSTCAFRSTFYGSIHVDHIEIR